MKTKQAWRDLMFNNGWVLPSEKETLDMVEAIQQDALQSQSDKILALEEANRMANLLIGNQADENDRINSTLRKNNVALELANKQMREALKAALHDVETNEGLFCTDNKYAKIIPVSPHFELVSPSKEQIKQALSLTSPDDELKKWIRMARVVACSSSLDGQPVKDFATTLLQSVGEKV